MGGLESQTEYTWVSRSKMRRLEAENERLRALERWIEEHAKPAFEWYAGYETSVGNRARDALAALTPDRR